MFGFFGSSEPTVPTYPELSTPTTDEEYAQTAEKAKTTILEVLGQADGWTDMESDQDYITLKTKQVEGSPANIARAEAVLDVSVDKLLAEVSGTDGERFKSQEPDLLDWKIVKTINDTNRIVYSGHHTQFPTTNRELCYLRTVHNLEDGKVLVCGVSINNKDVATVDGRVRAVVLACWLFTPQGDKTHVTRCIQLDPKGSVPTFLINLQQKKAATAIDILKKAVA